jgi:hypothetical protein
VYGAQEMVVAGNLACCFREEEREKEGKGKREGAVWAKKLGHVNKRAARKIINRLERVLGWAERLGNSRSFYLFGLV